MKINPGIYKHYKDKLYKVIGCAKHTETQEEFVIYKALYGDYQLWIRPKKMFIENVEVNGKQIPRFQLVKESKEKSNDL